jgi:hypothetical protein
MAELSPNASPRAPPPGLSHEDLPLRVAPPSSYYANVNPDFLPPIPVDVPAEPTPVALDRRHWPNEFKMNTWDLTFQTRENKMFHQERDTWWGSHPTSDPGQTLLRWDRHVDACKKAWFYKNTFLYNTFYHIEEEDWMIFHIKIIWHNNMFNDGIMFVSTTWRECNVVQGIPSTVENSNDVVSYFIKRFAD